MELESTSRNVGSLAVDLRLLGLAVPQSKGSCVGCRADARCSGDDFYFQQQVDIGAHEKREALNVVYGDEGHGGERHVRTTDCVQIR